MTDNLRGAAFMTASMAGFAVEDMFLKAAARLMPMGEALVLFGILGTIAFMLLTRARGEPVFHAAILSPPLLARSGFEVVGRLFYALAVAWIPLSLASAILQAAPLVVVAGAALVFGEKVGWQRWAAIAVGFAGVLVIIRPGLKGFDALSLIAVVGMLGFAGRDLATRAAPKVLSNMQLGIYGFAMLSLAGCLILVVTGGAVLPELRGAALVLGATVFGVSGYYALTVAMRTGEVSFVTPFRYARLLFAIILGVLVFRERPEAATLIGSAIVVASGIYTLSRGNRI